jgi:hypothetical protein
MKRTKEIETENEVLDAIERLVDRLWYYERAKYESEGRPAGSLFPSLELVNRWTHGVRREVVTPPEPAPSYSASHGLPSGHLVDVSERARQLGHRLPVTLTVPVWEGGVAVRNPTDRRTEATKLDYLLNVLGTVLNSGKPIRPGCQKNFVHIPEVLTFQLLAVVCEMDERGILRLLVVERDLD